MKNADAVWDLVDAHREAFVELSDRVFDTPETLYAEVRSCAAHAEMLSAQGFRVTPAAAGIPTAVIGEAGDGGPVIAILGEYDALPGLSQMPGVAEHQPLVEGGDGHGCGHNLLGSAALLAATAIKDWLAETGIKARVRYYGCPAEEGGAAKTYMVRAGLFDDVDAAITWHPASYTCVDHANSLANTRIDFTFTGRAAHAAGAPELGRSALDAVELMNVGVNYLREHMPDDARIHYAYLDAGGTAPNVVQARATVRQLIRARDLTGLRALVARVQKVAAGAALMTETEVSTQVFSGVSNLLGNRPLEEAMQRALEALGPVPFDAADEDFARAIRKTLSEDDIAATFRRIGMEPDYEKPLCDFIAPLDRRSMGARGRPTWATCPGRCRRCRRGWRPARSARRSTLGSSPRRASRRWRTRGWCMPRRRWPRPRAS
jgi:aminobenzoyl-glutamate utilization protein B